MLRERVGDNLLVIADKLNFAMRGIARPSLQRAFARDDRAAELLDPRQERVAGDLAARKVAPEAGQANG